MAIEPWRVESSRYVVRDRWIRLRADVCVTPHGHRLDPYYVLEYADWVHVAVFDDDLNVMVIRLYRHGAGEVALEIPSGVVEPGESPEVTAARELLEETGHAPERIEPLGSFTPNSATHTNRSHCLMALGCRPVSEPTFDESEQIEHEWVSPSTMAQWIDRGVFTQALQLNALLLAFRRLGLPREEPGAGRKPDERYTVPS